MGDKKDKGSGTDTKSDPKTQTTSVEQLLGKVPFILRFEMQNTFRATSATSLQLLKLAMAQKKTVSKLSLSSLRTFTEMGAKDYFCLDDKITSVNENMTITDYIACTPSNTSALGNESDASPAVVKTSILTVYSSKFIVRPTSADLDKVGTGPPISLDVADDKGTKVTLDNLRLPEGYKSSDLNASTYAAAVSYQAVKHPADMTEREWDVVVKNNILTNGYVVDRSGVTYIARHAAFKFKPRQVEAFVVSAGDLAQVTSAIPEFRVFDESSVKVLEISNEAQQTVADNSFSSFSVKASGSGGAFGITAGASAGYSTEQSQGSGQSSGKFQSTLRVSYNFPRVIVFLDEDSIVPTTDCAKMLNSIQNEKEKAKRDPLIARFYAKFGHVLSTEVQLGGCLNSQKLSVSVTGQTVHEKMEKMKVAAGVSFATPYGGGSASIERGQGSDSSSQSSTTNKTESLTWSAKGGDTLLCSNPPAWASTVQDFYNWRVMERSFPRAMSNILENMPGYETFGSLLSPSAPKQATANLGVTEFD